MKQNLTINILEVLSDGDHHHRDELIRCGGHRFGGRICELKKKGIRFSKFTVKGVDYWKLESIPKELEIINKRIKRNLERQKQFRIPEIRMNGELEINVVDNRSILRKIGEAFKLW